MTDAKEDRPGRATEAMRSSLRATAIITDDTDTHPSRAPLVSHRFEVARAELGQVAARVIEESILAALPSTWERRAAEFERAKPHPTDFHGRATPAELRARCERLDGLVTACRAHAELLRDPAPAVAREVSQDVATALPGVMGAVA